MTRLYYFAHPVAPPCTCDVLHSGNLGSRRAGVTAVHGPHPETVVACNCDRARRWLRWLLEGAPDVAFVASWLPYVDVLPEDKETGGQWRERGLRDNSAVAARCDGTVLVGGHVSSGMEREASMVRTAGGRVVDLTRLGAEPPQTPLEVQRPRITFPSSPKGGRMKS